MSLTAAPAAGASLASVVVEDLLALGIEQAFGVSGGAMAALWHAMSASRLRVRHFRHESGAAFAAAEAYFATGRPVLLFTTTGPGLTNALTGVLAARGEGAKLVLVSACTSAPLRGRFAIQESSPETLPRGLYESGPLFHFARRLDDVREWPGVARELARGLARRCGFVAHVAIPTALQSLPAHRPAALARCAGAAALASASASVSAPAPGEAAPAAVRACLHALADGPFAVWVGFGARNAAGEVRELVERSGAAVFCTPRGKGIVPETHPRFVGVSGIGGHESVPAWIVEHAPARILVLGSRLGEASSLLDPRFVPRQGFIHVDIDPAVPGSAFPTAATLPVVADVRALLRELLSQWSGPVVVPVSVAVSAAVAPATSGQRRGGAALPLSLPLPLPSPSPLLPPATRPADAQRVHPAALMEAIQREVVEPTDAIVFAESGNSFAWATHLLRFPAPGRYRASTGVGAMGHAGAGAVGAALGSGRRAVAVVGDGAMLMQNEISTAVKYAAPVTWIVLNDGRYGMCAQGMDALGLAADALFPAVDFAAFARAQGADGVCVSDADDLPAALRQAMQAGGPFVVDVLIDLQVPAPAGARNRMLAREHAGEVSFPARAASSASCLPT